jgi:hypothetical protein
VATAETRRRLNLTSFESKAAAAVALERATAILISPWQSRHCGQETKKIKGEDYTKSLMERSNH